MSAREQVCLVSGFAFGVVTGFAAAMVVTRSKPQQATAQREVSKPEPPSSNLPEPWVDYSVTPIQQIRESLRDLSLAEREAVRVYEESNLKRRGILNVLSALEQERVNGKS